MTLLVPQEDCSDTVGFLVRQGWSHPIESTIPSQLPLPVHPEGGMKILPSRVLVYVHWLHKITIQTLLYQFSNDTNHWPQQTRTQKQPEACSFVSGVSWVSHQGFSTGNIVAGCCPSHLERSRKHCLQASYKNEMRWIYTSYVCVGLGKCGLALETRTLERKALYHSLTRRICVMLWRWTDDTFWTTWTHHVPWQLK